MAKETLQTVKAQIIGFYRQGADEATIAAIFDVSAAYVDLILGRYFEWISTERVKNKI